VHAHRKDTEHRTSTFAYDLETVRHEYIRRCTKVSGGLETLIKYRDTILETNDLSVLEEFAR